MIAPEDIQGWMLEPSLQWLRERAAESMAVIEVGCWRGRSTLAMARRIPMGGLVVAVDRWSGHVEEGVAEDAYRDFRVNLASEIESGKVLVMKMHSFDAARILRPRAFDFVFIDADHEYGAVAQDIRSYLPLVKHGGTLSGHDYGTCAGVTHAVDELVPGFQRGPDSIWWKRV